MTTASFQDWTGIIGDIGPIYPFVGSEVWLWIIGVVLWIVWHVIQLRRENKRFQEQIERFGKPETLKQIINTEDPSNP